MMQRNMKSVGVVLVLALAVWGCGGEDQTGSAPDPGETAALMAEWRTFVPGVPETLTEKRPAMIAFELISISPEAIGKLVAVLEDPSEDPRAKVLAYTSLMPLLEADTDGSLIINRVLALTEPEIEPTSRACALQLLAQVMQPAWEPMFARNLDDPDSRVRLSAASGLAALGGKDAHDRLSAILNDPEGLDKEREQAAVDLLKAPGMDDLPDMMVILKDAGMPLELRVNAAAALGSLGSPDILGELEIIATTPGEAAPVQEMVRSARMAIIERNQADLAEEARPAQEEGGSAPAQETPGDS
jgi:HEAT repeat protein